MRRNATFTNEDILAFKNSWASAKIAVLVSAGNKSVQENIMEILPREEW